MCATSGVIPLADLSGELHEDEISIDEALVRRLVDDQFPQFRDLDLERLGASGSSNALFRLGGDRLVRLPRQPGGGASVLKEVRWTPVVTDGWSVDVPEVVCIGEPTDTFGEHWAISSWLEGEHPSAWQMGERRSDARAALARDLADVVLSLRATPVSSAAAKDPALRWYRGRPLAEYDRYFAKTVRTCRELPGLDVDLDALATAWQEALALPVARDHDDRWFHSDLVAENLLLRDGRLSAVLDFGALAVGDPCIDLHGAWELFDPPAREIFRTRLGVDDAEWQRGRAWALAIALGALAYYWHSMPGRRHDRLAMLRAAMADIAND